MNNYNPFLPQSSFLDQKTRARKRLQIAVLFSISLSVMALMALLIQGCRKPNDNSTESDMDTNATPELPATPPEMASNAAPAPAPDTNIPAPTPVPAPLPPPPAAPVAQAEDYTVVKGDTFATIAKNNHVSVRAIEDANPGVDPKRLKIGQKLHMPAASAPSGGVTQSTSGGTGEMATSGGELTYKVKSGDTLTSIARHYHVTIKAIQSANNLTTTSIKVGKVLKIPGAAAPAPAPAPAQSEMLPPPATPAPATSAPTAAPGT